MSGSDPLSAPWGHQQLQLTPEANAFLQLLRELGHLDGALFEAFLQELSPPIGALTQEPLALGRDDIRRLVGAYLFARSSELPPESLELLAREWPLLFG
ncbi:MAG TPA: hypothetical protein QGF58_28920 [Myxococcota bacterium]|nr:hypothetical protein [Myxococcota bacterium]